MTDQILPLGEGWDLHAHQWIAWSRTGEERGHRLLGAGEGSQPVLGRLRSP